MSGDKAKDVRSADRAELRKLAEVGDQKISEAIDQYLPSLERSLRDIDSSAMRDAALTEFGSRYAGESKPAEKAGEKDSGGTGSTPVLFWGVLGLGALGLLGIISLIV